ncbi:acyl-CoA carboxylase subunit epsilon [Streptomyces sp. BBFR2]|uniref:acyl-CoA carboxylase subunit epsilon n=1 Tax=Streptomyces sp. BBFR2 TaxID=3372854 RepID=UPI0037D9D3A4
MTAPPGAPRDIGLRIEGGVAEPEELAAITVILYARLAVGVSADGADWVVPPDDSERHHHPPRSACWSGCWCCG